MKDIKHSSNISDSTKIFFLFSFLLFSFFFPPIPFGSRTIYFVDFWCLAFCIYYFLKLSSTDRKKIFFPSAFLVTVLFLIYIHGYFRVPLKIAGDENRFEPLREFIHLVRLSTWGVLCVIFFNNEVGLTEKQKSFFKKFFTISLILFLIVLVFQKFFKSFEIAFAEIYKIDINLPQWAWRKSSFFRSPNEASLVITFLLIYLFEKNFLNIVFSLFAILLTTFITHSATPVFSLMLSLLILVFKKYFTNKKVMFSFLISFILFLILFFVLQNHNDYFHLKVINFLARVRDWTVFSKSFLLSPHHLFFGQGFSSNYTDNFYFWLLNRGGLVLFSVFVLGVFIFLNSISFLSKTGFLFLYVAIASTSLDAFIYRPIVALLIFLVATTKKSK